MIGRNGIDGDAGIGQLPPLPFYPLDREFRSLLALAMEPIAAHLLRSSPAKNAIRKGSP